MYELELLDALRNNGLIVKELVFDKIVRVPTTDKPNKQNGWYRAFHEPVAMIVYGNWAIELVNKYVVKSAGVLSRKDFIKLQSNIKLAKANRLKEQVNEWRKNKLKIEQVLSQCQPIAGTIAERYLNNRGITKTDYDALLFHPKLAYWDKDKGVSYHPAMIGVVTNPANQIVTLHRTYLTEDGRKAEVSDPKKLMAVAGDTKGASIKLGKPETLPNEHVFLGIAEGIETALSAGQLFDIPVWACVSADGMSKFHPPIKPSITHLTIYADNDPAGIKAGNQVGKRLAGEGLRCVISTPLHGADWNDELIGGDDE